MTTAAGADCARRPAGIGWRLCGSAVGRGILLYTQLSRIAAVLTYDLAGLPRGSALGSAVEFFVFEAPKVLLLLIAVVFVVGVVRSFFTPERARRAARRAARGVGQRPRRAPRRRDAVLLLLGGAALHRVRDGRRARSA